MSPLVAVLLGVLVALLATALVGVVLVHRLRAVAAEERRATVQSAVDTVVSVASSKLGDTTEAGRRELELRTKSFEDQVAHIGDALGQVGALVAELQKERAEQTGSLVARLREVARTQQDLADHTQHLRQALANPKQRGQWGERMAEDVLRAAGFRRGVNYLTQTAIEGGTIPDFRFLLPNDLELRMDVKFPVDNYLRVLEADDDAAADRHRRAFVQDVRNHVKGLAGRGYVDASDTVDCLLVFIPNEAVYGFLHESDPDIVDLALAHQVILCSPSTLFGVLAVVRRSVEQFQLERRSDQILRCLGAVSGEWDKFLESLDKLGRQLGTVTKTFDELNGTRRRVFQRRLDEIEELQATEQPVASGEALAARKAAGDVRPLPIEADELPPGEDEGDDRAAG